MSSCQRCINDSTCFIMARNQMVAGVSNEGFKAKSYKKFIFFTRASIKVKVHAKGQIQGYVADSDLDEDPEEDPEEDYADYPADEGDGDDEPSDDDDDDDDDADDEDEEPFEDEDDDEEEEHLALADSSIIPVVDPVPSAGDTKAFETDEYEVGENSTAARRPTGGHRADYGFIGTMDAEIRRQRAEEVGYGIKDVWVDSTEAVEEVAPTALEGVNARVTKLDAVQEVDGLVEDRQFHYETARLLDREALVSREAWVHSVGLSLAVHYEMQAYRTHTQMQDYRIASQESLMTTLIAQVSSLQGQLSAALGQIQALQARDQTHADDPEGAGSSA
ncbi:hypothetical protein Tco_0398385 [Tanacetum coccineum]